MVGGKGRKYRLIIFIIKHVVKSSNIIVFIYQSGSGCHGNPAHRMVTHLAGVAGQQFPRPVLPPAVRPYPEKDRKRQETPKKTRKRPKKTLFSTEFYII